MVSTCYMHLMPHRETCIVTVCDGVTVCVFKCIFKNISAFINVVFINTLHFMYLMQYFKINCCILKQCIKKPLNGEKWIPFLRCCGLVVPRQLMFRTSIEHVPTHIINVLHYSIILSIIDHSQLLLLVVTFLFVFHSIYKVFKYIYKMYSVPASDYIQRKSSLLCLYVAKFTI